MNTINKIASFLLVGFLFLSVPGRIEAAQSNEPVTVRIGNITYDEIIIAEKKGFFEEELNPLNARAEIFTFPSGPPQIEALAANELDISVFGDQPALQTIVSGVPVKIISGISDSSDGFGLIARTGSGIKEVKDIKGHKIAAPAGTTAHQLLLAMLEQNGLSLEDIEFYNLANANIIPSLVAGDIDGAVAFGIPFTDPPVDEGVAQIHSGRGYKRNVNVIAARIDFIEKNPDVTIAFLRAVQKAAKWRAENFEESLAIVGDWTGTDKEVLRKSSETSLTLLLLDESAKDAVLTSAGILFRGGILPELPAKELLFDDRFAKEAGLITYPGWGSDRVDIQNE
jgi:aliphatic sulfonates family ABC transporter substrate-binding protein